jgi:hypothetical protein
VTATARPSLVSFGLVAAVGGVTVLLTALTLVPEEAASAVAPATVRVAAPVAPVRSRTEAAEPRRTVRMVYPGPITAR